MKTINDRLREVLNVMFEGNVSEFARKSHIPQPTLNNIVGNRKSKPSSDNLERLINSIESVNAEWLLTGNGNMLKDGSANQIVRGNKNNVRSYSNVNDTNIVSEGSAQYQNTSELELLKQENKHLKELLEEKERMIQILIKKD